MLPKCFLSTAYYFAGQLCFGNLSPWHCTQVYSLNLDMNLNQLHPIFWVLVFRRINCRSLLYFVNKNKVGSE
jgi:hypothetical protein